MPISVSKFTSEIKKKNPRITNGTGLKMWLSEKLRSVINNDPRHHRVNKNRKLSLKILLVIFLFFICFNRRIDGAGCDAGIGQGWCRRFVSVCVCTSISFFIGVECLRMHRRRRRCGRPVCLFAIFIIDLSLLFSSSSSYRDWCQCHYVGCRSVS